MSGRKPNLESTISETPNSNGLYEAKVWMGYRPDGKPDRRHVQRKNLASVRKRVRELEKQRDEGRVAKPGKIPTIREMIERHLDTILPNQEASPATIRSYRSLAEHHIYTRWGGQRADRLLPADIQDGIAAWRRAGLSVATRRKIFAVLSSAFSAQVQAEALSRNPCDKVKAPVVPESAMPHLTQAEMRSVIAVTEKRANSTRWEIGLATGLRQGEALGLRWEYLNLATGEMRIWWQIQRLKWEHGCPKPHACARPHCKTKPCAKNCPKHTRACPLPCPKDCTAHASLCEQRRLPEDAVPVSGALVLRPVKERRHKTVHLAAAFVDRLKAHRDKQYLAKLTAADEWEDHDLVWCQWNGRPLDPRRDWGEWGEILKAAGLPHQRVHAIRHSAATMLRDQDVAAEVIQETLGHSDIRVTRRYTHTRKGASLDASERAAEALGISPERSS